jgi:lysophospholipase L1-like esterase
MLGTNDFQSMHPHNVWHSAEGLAAVVRAIRRAPIEPGMPIPPVLIVVPPAIRSPRGTIAPKFEGAEAKCAGLPEAYARVARDERCEVFDANTVTTSSAVDGIHLDAGQHATLGHALAARVVPLIAAAGR